MDNQNKKWYQRAIGIILLLVLFFPVGLFLMWKYANWSPRVKWVITGIFIFILFIGMIRGNKPSQDNAKPETVKVEASAEPTINFTFDIPSLIDKNLDQIVAVLGNSTDPDPTAQQIKLANNRWSKTFKKDGKTILVNYKIVDKSIIDFFIDTDDPSGKTQDKNHLLQVGNLKENDPKYRVQFIKVVIDPNYYTGVKVIPNKPDKELDADVKFSAVAFQITNNEDDNWNDCKLELNPGIIRGGYTYKQALFSAKDVLVIPFREFTKGDGTRFSPYDTKAQNLSITCTVDGKLRFGHYTIN